MDATANSRYGVFRGKDSSVCYRQDPFTPIKGYNVLITRSYHVRGTWTLKVLHASLMGSSV